MAVEHKPVKRRGGSFAIAIAVFVGALGIRLLYLWESADNPTFLVPIVDAEVYHGIARSLVEGEGMSNSFFWQPFFYPFFLSIIYFFTGPAIVAAKTVQVVIGASCCALTYLLGERVIDRRTGVVAGVTTALCGPLIFYDAELVAAGLAALWSVVLVLLFLGASERKTPRLCFWLGVCGALSILTRPTILLFFAAGCLWLALVFARGPGRWRALAGGGGSLIAGFLLVAVPVARQNARLTGRYGILPSSGGINFYIGNNEDACATLTTRPGSGWQHLTELPNRHGVKDDMWLEQRFFYDQVLEFAQDQPLAFAGGMARKALQFLSSREIPRNVDLYTFADWSRVCGLLTWKAGGFGFPFGVMLPLAIIGIVRHGRKLTVPVILFLILYPLAIVLVFVTARYRVPTIPVMAVASAAGFWVFADAIRQRRRGLLVVTACGAGAVAVLTSFPGQFCEETPNYRAELYYCLAGTTASQGRLDESIRHYKHALEIVPDFVDAHHNLGAELAELGKFDEAVAHYEEALRIRPHRHETLNNLSMVRLQQGKFDEVRRLWEEMLRLEPDDYKTRYNLGKLLFNQGDLDGAIGQFEESLKANPDYARAHSNLGVALTRKGRFEEAVAHHSQVLSLEPDHPNGYTNLVVALVQLGRIDEAVSRCDAALIARPLDIEVQYARAYALEHGGRIGEAVEQYEQLLQIDPDHSRARARLQSLQAKQAG